MKWNKWIGVWVTVFTCVAGLANAQRQLGSPHLGYAYPAGGQQGTTVDVVVGGQAIANPKGCYISGDGIEVTVGTYTRPLNQKEVQDIRDKLTEAAKKLNLGGNVRAGLPRLTNLTALKRIANEAGVSDEQLKGFISFVQNRADPKRQANPQLAEMVELHIKIDPQATPGIRELRVLTPLGLTNPIRFLVGRLPEFNETEPNDKIGNDVGSALPVILNGQILPGDIDRFTFHARKGAKLVFDAAAREITPYLADAVPGWFQATLSLYDSKGAEVATADHNQFEQDPVMYYVVPNDGEYTLEIRDSIYRGREDFTYRIAVGEIPYITSIFPLGGLDGKLTTVNARGWNLPSTRVQTDGGLSRERTILLKIGQGKTTSNSVSYAVDNLPEVFEKEPNHDSAHAQLVALPVIVNGKIAHAGEKDIYKFKGKAGQKLVAEVEARRLGSPLDSILILTDANGKLIASNDDFDDKGAGLITHQADSYFCVTLPATGVYTLTIRDTEKKGGPDFGYRLRISPPKPDFELRIVPSSFSARAGMNAAVTVYALRKDGFDGDIALELKDAPQGFSLSGGCIPGSIDKARFTLAVTSTPSGEPAQLRLEGKANIGGKEIRHVAVPAEDMMQAFAYRHLVPMNTWMVSVIGRPNRGLSFAAPDAPVKLWAGKEIEVHIAGPAKILGDNLIVELNEGPEGVSVTKAVGAPGDLQIGFKIDGTKIKIGVKGNLILDVYTERTVTPAKGKAPVKRRILVGTLPAIPFEIVK